MLRAQTLTTELRCALCATARLDSVALMYSPDNYIDVLGPQTDMINRTLVTLQVTETRCFYFSVIVQKQKQSALSQVFPFIFLITFDKFAWNHFGAFLVGNDTFL